MKNNNEKLFRWIVVVAALLLALSGCGGGGGGGGGSTGSNTSTGSGTGTGTGTDGATLLGISVSPSSATVKVGGSQQFKATGSYVNTTTYAYTTVDITSSVVWSSSAPGVATVNASGLASGVSSGTSTITATSGAYSGTATLSVTNWTTRRSAPRSSMPLNLAFDGTTYVATGEATSTSSDLVIWDEQDSIASDNDIAWNGSSVSPVFVRGGFFGISSSTDGKSWVGGYSTSSNPPIKIAYSSTLPLWVAVGSAGHVYTSPDGINWNTATPTSADLYSVVWSGTQFVVGGAGTILTSPDGVTWTTHTMSNDFFALGTNSSLLVGCTSYAGTGSGIYTSTDGITWNFTGSTITDCSSIIYAGGQWVAVGFGFSATSPDGITWTKSTSKMGGLESVIFDGTQYVASGSDRWSNAAIYTSPDGINWTLKTAYTKNLAIARSATTGRLVVVTSTDKSMASSDNGVTWQYGGYDASNTGQFFSGVTWYPALGEFIAYGGLGVLTSTDGLSWSTIGSGYCYGKIEASPSLLINACSNYNGGVATSADGVTWTKPAYPSTQGVNDAYWTGSQWVGLGDGGDIVTSPDSTNWTLQTSGTTNSLYGFAASPSLMVAVGYYGTIVTSSDGGVTWTTQVSGTSTTLKRAIWTGTQFVAIGSSGVVLSSTNGVNWVTQPTGYNAMFASDPFDLTDIVQAGTSLVMTGSRGLVATSP